MLKCDASLAIRYEMAKFKAIAVTCKGNSQ